MDGCGFLSGSKYLIHDRDTKFCNSFRGIIKSGGVKSLKLPPKSPNLNAFAERWVLSIKSECISGLIFFREQSLQKTLKEYMVHYYRERNHQGKDNMLLFPDQKLIVNKGKIRYRKRLNGMLKYYYRSVA